MSWSLVYTAAAVKQLRKIDPHQRALILSWMDKNIDGCDDPRIHGKGLVADHSGEWRYRIGDYRVLCELDDGVLIVYALSIGHRREVYNR